VIKNPIILADCGRPFKTLQAGILDESENHTLSTPTSAFFSRKQLYQEQG